MGAGSPTPNLFFLIAMKLIKTQLSYVASLMREDLANGVMAWDTPEGQSLTREDIRELCEAIEGFREELQ